MASVPPNAPGSSRGHIGGLQQYLHNSGQETKARVYCDARRACASASSVPPLAGFCEAFPSSGSSASAGSTSTANRVAQQPQQPLCPAVPGGVFPAAKKRSQAPTVATKNTAAKAPQRRWVVVVVATKTTEEAAPLPMKNEEPSTQPHTETPPRVTDATGSIETEKADTCKGSNANASNRFAPLLNADCLDARNAIVASIPPHPVRTHAEGQEETDGGGGKQQAGRQDLARVVFEAVHERATFCDASLRPSQCKALVKAAEAAVSCVSVTMPQAPAIAQLQQNAREQSTASSETPPAPPVDDRHTAAEPFFDEQPKQTVCSECQQTPATVLCDDHPHTISSALSSHAAVQEENASKTPHDSAGQSIEVAAPGIRVFTIEQKNINEHENEKQKAGGKRTIAANLNRIDVSRSQNGKMGKACLLEIVQANMLKLKKPNVCAGENIEPVQTSASMQVRACIGPKCLLGETCKTHSGKEEPVESDASLGQDGSSESKRQKKKSPARINPGKARERRLKRIALMIEGKKERLRDAEVRRQKHHDKRSEVHFVKACFL